MRHTQFVFRWVALWSQCNMLDGLREHFCLYDSKAPGAGMRFFTTKKACKAHITERYGYIARRADLLEEPHC